MLYLTIYYLTAGFTLGSLLLIHKAVPLHPLLWSFLPIHVEYLLWGWTTQLALAVGYAIFPRFRADPVRGNPSVYWAMLVLFNLGIIISGFSDYSFASPGCRSAASWRKSSASVVLPLISGSGSDLTRSDYFLK